MKQLLLFILCLGIFSNAIQGQELNNENIWYKSTFRQKNVPGFNFMKDGQHYSKLESGSISKYQFLNGKKAKTLFSEEDWETELNSSIDDYNFSKDENYIILLTNKKLIYRRSYTANVYVYDIEAKKLSPIFDKPIQVPTLSPSGDQLAFVFENNLYIRDLNNLSVNQITKDGKKNSIINGHADWVYEEEFGITRMFEWSPDGQHIAFVQLDETEVPNYSIRYYNNELYPNDYHFKYPKVGENNASWKLFIYDVEKASKSEIKIKDPAHYIPRLAWIPRSDNFSFIQLNRHQNDLSLMSYDSKNAVLNRIYHETNERYLDMPDKLRYTSDGKKLLWQKPDAKGFNHLYMIHTEDGKSTALTSGNWSVTGLNGYSEKDDNVYFSAAKVHSTQREVYKYNIGRKELTRLSPKDGFNSGSFNSTFDFFINRHSTLNRPVNIEIIDNKGKTIKRLEKNESISATQKNLGVEKLEMISVPNGKGDQLNGYIMPPKNMEKGKEYPMLMFVYGGPGSQMVMDKMPRYYWWFQMLSEKGYYVACVDGRGTGGRGEDFQKGTYLKLGDLETKDQIAAAKHFAAMPTVDKERIGIFGWSYGGYLSSLCILKGAEVFKSAIAVAPVTNWRWYDSIYTERYMQTEKENAEGYRNNSPVNFAHMLKGNYLIAHGTGDDNVHPQHSYEMVDRLIEENKRFDMLFYPNRNHGIYGSFTRWHLFDEITDFITEKL